MIENIVYDFGYVLAYPKSGNWFIPPNTRRILGVKNCLLVLMRFYRLSGAFHHGHRVLNENHLLFTEDEEIKQFSEFYELILKDMGIKKNRSRISELLAADTVSNDDKVIFYSDVLKELKRAKENYHISVLSDTWPSLKRLFDHIGITPLLDGLVMSCDYGICKDNIRLFYEAASKLQIEPYKSVFIDDSETNLENAQKAGFVAILMDRYGKVKHSKFPVVHNLAEVYQLVEGLRFP
jgi:putative hydrolase of the HAD superfamily